MYQEEIIKFLSNYGLSSYLSNLIATAIIILSVTAIVVFINYITKRIDRSYDKIFDFIYKIDQMSLKKKKSIDLKIIKEVLGE